MSEELKPCPFCGGEAIGFEWSDDDEVEEGEQHGYDAYCGVKVNHKDNCVLEVGEFYCWFAQTEEEAAVLWNRRAERTCEIVSLDDSHGRCDACGEEYDYHDMDHLPGNEPFEYDGCYCKRCGGRVV